MIRIIFFGDNHSNQYCTKVLINVLDDLCKQGYKTIFWEDTAAIDELIESIKFGLRTLKCFPDEVDVLKDWGELDADQKDFWKDYCPSNTNKNDNELENLWEDKNLNVVYPYVEKIHEKYSIPGRVEAREASIILLNKIKALNMDFVPINTTEFKPLSEERQSYMTKQITKRIESTGFNGNFIVFVGGAHVNGGYTHKAHTHSSQTKLVPSMLELLKKFIKPKNKSCRIYKCDLQKESDISYLSKSSSIVQELTNQRSLEEKEKQEKEKQEKQEKQEKEEKKAAISQYSSLKSLIALRCLMWNTVPLELEKKKNEEEKNEVKCIVFR